MFWPIQHILYLNRVWFQVPLLDDVGQETDRVNVEFPFFTSDKKSVLRETLEYLPYMILVFFKRSGKDEDIILWWKCGPWLSCREGVVQ